MKVTKNGKFFFVNSFEGSFFNKLKRALVNFLMSFLIDSFWEKVQNNNWEKETYNIFDNFLDKNNSYIDIGAWIGPTVLYGCQLSKHCYAIEPDFVAYQSLKSNIELNKNLINKITLYNGAISNITGKMAISARFGLGDSMSSVLERNSDDILFVGCLKFNDFINRFKINDCNFVKIDAEGAEVLILLSMSEFIKQNKPTIHLSLHPFLFKNLREDSKKILNTLKLYKNVYDNRGNILNYREIEEKLLNKKLFDIVLTDLNWSKK
ncbi:FkbM family methyltransferase [Candidatus Woesearchaeota archaeon]|nr:FkbM family methyltransferase [Candidatus Woesearchaeota archaeon]